MGVRGPVPSKIKAHVITLYQRGILASLSEGALIADVDKMQIYRWLAEVHLDWRKSRLRYVGTLIERSELAPRLTKKQLRADAERAKAAWDKSQASIDNDSRKEWSELPPEEMP